MLQHRIRYVKHILKYVTIAYIQNYLYNRGLNVTKS